jgi:hypothetical protein
MYGLVLSGGDRKESARGSAAKSGRSANIEVIEIIEFTEFVDDLDTLDNLDNLEINTPCVCVFIRDSLLRVRGTACAP